MPRAGLEPAHPKTGDFKTSATPFIPIYADPATIGVCAETVTSAAFAKNSISTEYGPRGPRNPRAYGYLGRPKKSAAEPLDLDPQRTSSGRERLRVLLRNRSAYLRLLPGPCVHKSRPVHQGNSAVTSVEFWHKVILLAKLTESTDKQTVVFGTSHPRTPSNRTWFVRCFCSD